MSNLLRVSLRVELASHGGHNTRLILLNRGDDDIAPIHESDLSVFGKLLSILLLNVNFLWKEVIRYWHGMAWHKEEKYIGSNNRLLAQRFVLLVARNFHLLRLSRTVEIEGHNIL